MKMVARSDPYNKKDDVFSLLTWIVLQNYYVSCSIHWFQEAIENNWPNETRLAQMDWRVQDKVKPSIDRWMTVIKQCFYLQLTKLGKNGLFTLGQLGLEAREPLVEQLAEAFVVAFEGDFFGFILYM